MILEVDVLAEAGFGPLVIAGAALGASLIYCFIKFVLPELLGGH